MLTHEEILARLNALAEPEYAKFNASLIPCHPPMLGVRLPALRKLARELVKAADGDAAAAITALTPDTFEERMLHGIAITCARLPDEERRRLLEGFLPLIDNWSVCDSVCTGCKFMAKSPNFWLPWLRALAAGDNEFRARFGIVCLMDHFTADNPAGRRETLAACANAVCAAPYAQLGIAWAVSMVAVKEPELGLEFLRSDSLCAATHNKAIQKIRESLRPTPEYKAAVAALRR